MPYEITHLSAKWHKWTHPATIAARDKPRQAAIQFTYPVDMEGWVDLVRRKNILLLSFIKN